MSLLRLPFILSDVIGLRVASTPPNPSPPFSEHIIPDWREKFLKSLAWPSAILRGLTWTAATIEILLILANHLLPPSSPLSHFVISTFTFNESLRHDHHHDHQHQYHHYTHLAPNLSTTPSPSHLPPPNLDLNVNIPLIIGTLLIICGTLLRVSCYRHLGKLFTFELCIQSDHRLIISGPYSFVRHPSYTGLILCILGTMCCHLSGSWVRESGVLGTMVGRVLVGFWVLTASSVVASLVLRVAREDELLRKKFGREWEEWSRVVKYGILPGVF